ncbi:MAG: hypothetical protein HRT44_12475 [Bdellovibrionales bacterium]|nr:hypothetical protein [Bdellovibrionales bacterium]
MAPTVINMIQRSDKIQTSPQVCRTIAQNVINKIQSNGSQNKIHRTPINSETLVLNDDDWHKGKYSYNTAGVDDEIGAHETFRWDSFPLAYWDGNRYILNSPPLIQGAVNGLLSIYNSNANLACSQQDGIEISAANGIDELLPTNISNNYEVSSRIRIRPYRLNSGVIEPCSSPLRLRPYGNTEPPQAVAEGYAVLPGYRPDLGLEAEVIVTTKKNAENDEEEITCSVKERFQFERIVRSVLPPRISLSGNNFQIRLPQSEFDPGTQIICRAASTTINLTGLGSDALPPPGSFSPWGPCKDTPVCGSAGTITYNSARTNMTKSIANATNCMVTLHVRGIDHAGNLSSTRSRSFIGGHGSPETPDPPTGGGGGGGFEVAGYEFNSYAHAQKASQLSGMPISPIDNVTVDAGKMLAEATAAMNDAIDSKNAAGNQATAAQNAASTAQAAVNGLSSLGPSPSSSAAQGAINAAQGAMNTASQSVATAQSAVNAAQSAVSAADAAAAAAAAGKTGMSGISEAAAEKAKEAAVEAQEALEAAEAALAAAKAAEEAARKAKEAAERAKAEAEAREAEDDDNDNTI